MGFHVFHEVSREIIAQQIKQNLTATPWQDVDTFSEMVFSGRIRQYHSGTGLFSFYDRGIPDIAAFLMKDKLPIPEHIWTECVANRYENPIFITPPWEAIFRQDNERKEDFIAAARVHKALEHIYSELGYDLIPVPMASISGRAKFILETIGEKVPPYTERGS